MANDCTTALAGLPDQSHHSYRRGGVDFAFVVNRRDRNLRVYDFRVGAYPEKRDFFDRIARENDLRKVYLVVEKRDSMSWRNVGFSREGSIPGYFRTVDALVMCRHYDDGGAPVASPKLKPVKFGDAPLPAPAGLRPVVVTDPVALRQAVEQFGSRISYVPFSREHQLPDLGIRARIGRRELWVTAETEPAYAHAKLDILTPPVDRRGAAALRECVERLCRILDEKDLVTVFAPCHADDELANVVFAELGFRTTARLANHLARGEDLVGAHVWHRRLSERVLRTVPTPAEYDDE
jgi:hypothetical protein